MRSFTYKGSSTNVKRVQFFNF